ncbi:hypothetical protein KM043_015621 [Ampulex compressa]|nr:hypothetical protein KM043_015621 [Ampulex compressa]
MKMLGVACATLNKENSFSNDARSSAVRYLHSGIYHCCTFCSSGGKKEAVCGCKAIMPGGYRGCGHGHVGHPGVYHWSCCGSVLRHGRCLLFRKCMYQMQL